MNKDTIPEDRVSGEPVADQGNSVRESNNVITVLGSGRSGTSLLMQVLRELGMSTGGGAMVPGSGANPEGFMEDVDIVETHKALLDGLGMKVTSTLPDNWLDAPVTGNARKRLRQIMQQRVEQAGDQIWGFKDPRATTFMPLWVKLFNQPGFKPRYLLAVRDPESVIASLREQVKRRDAVNELLWLRRNIEALHNTAGNCFIIHYEDWFKRPEELVRGLLAYTGLDETFKGDVGEVVNRVVKAQLNRAPRQHQDVNVSNPCVTELYEVLRESRGENFDHATLMDRVERVRRIMGAFDAGIDRGAVKQNNASDPQETPKKSEVVALSNENGRLLRELTVMTKEVEGLRANLYGKARTVPTIEKTERPSLQAEKLRYELKKIRNSSSYKLGWIIVSAVKKPGMNTLKAPLRLGKLFIRAMRSRRRT